MHWSILGGWRHSILTRHTTPFGVTLRVPIQLTTPDCLTESPWSCLVSVSDKVKQSITITITITTTDWVTKTECDTVTEKPGQTSVTLCYRWTQVWWKDAIVRFLHILISGFQNYMCKAKWYVQFVVALFCPIPVTHKS